MHYQSETNGYSSGSSGGGYESSSSQTFRGVSGGEGGLEQATRYCCGKGCGAACVKNN